MRIDRTTRRRLAQARELLALPESPPLAEIARALDASTFQLIRQFAAAFGETPHQFRTRARLDHAKHLLASGMSVTDACMHVGFSSVGSFSALFSRHVGVSPLAYRRRLVQVLRQVPRALSPGCYSLMALLPAEAFRNSREAPRAAPRQSAKP
jgi:AraC-like DNA-binding protein